jgi:hypothetical protein
MHGFEWKDQRGIEGTGFVRALRILMTQNLDYFIPKISSTIEEQLENEIGKNSVKGKVVVQIRRSY